METSFKQYLQTLTEDAFSKHEITEIENAFKILRLKKNEYLVRQKQVCLYFCYVQTGILQHAVAVQGEEKTTYLALKNSFTSSLKSFLSETPSRKSIKAVFDSELFILDFATFDRLYKNLPAFKLFYHKLIERQIFLIDDYRIDLLTLTPEERYQKLLTNEPKLLEQVPLHYLSSLLGISMRHMSRIRRQIK
jgi:CRP-like cAMP-binding protein